PASTGLVIDVELGGAVPSRSLRQAVEQAARLPCDVVAVGDIAQPAGYLEIEQMFGRWIGVDQPPIGIERQETVGRAAEDMLGLGARGAFSLTCLLGGLDRCDIALMQLALLARETLGIGLLAFERASEGVQSADRSKCDEAKA